MKDTFDKLSEFPSAAEVSKFTDAQDSIRLKNELMPLLVRIKEAAEKKHYNIGIPENGLSKIAKDFLENKGYIITTGRLSNILHNVYIHWEEKKEKEND